MDITPMDIAHKEFARGFRGFDQTQVRDFLEQVSAALEKLLSERAQLLSEIENLKGNLERYHNIEETLQNTLVLAQRTSTATRCSSTPRADTLVRAEGSTLAISPCQTRPAAVWTRAGMPGCRAGA